MISKIEIGLAISRNFNVVKLSLLDEPIEYSNDEELKTKVREKFALLRAEIEREFKEEKPQTDFKPTPTSVEKLSNEQKKYLIDLGYDKPNINDLTKLEARELISELVNVREY